MHARFLGLSSLLHAGVLALILAGAFGLLTHNTIEQRPTSTETLTVITLSRSGAGSQASAPQESGPRIRMPVIKTPVAAVSHHTEDDELEQAPVAPAKTPQVRKPSPKLTQEQFNTLHGRPGKQSTSDKPIPKVRAAGLSELQGNGRTPNKAGLGDGGGNDGGSFEAALMGRIQDLLKAYKAERGDLVVAIAFVVSADGQCKGARVNAGSGDPAFDAMVLESVRQACVTPVPAEFVGRGYCINIRSRE